MLNDSSWAFFQLPKKKDNIIPNSKKNNPKNILIDFKLIRI
jgi:hypothetical protein